MGRQRKVFPPQLPGEVAGATLTRLLSEFAGLRLDELRTIAADESAPWSRRAAADRMIRAIGVADVTQFEPWLSGRESLDELRARGVNLTGVAKLRVNTWSNGGSAREIEFVHGGEEFDRITDRTAGKPTQRQEVAVTTPLEVVITTPRIASSTPQRAVSQGAGQATSEDTRDGSGS